MSTNNPFIYGRVIREDILICPRKKEEKFLMSNIHSGQNTYLIGERRMGKTTMVRKVLDKVSDEFLPVVVDFRAVVSLEDVQKRIMTSVISAASLIKDLEWFFKIFSSYRPTATPGTDGSMEFSVTVNANNSLDNLSLMEIFDFIEKTHKRRKIVIFFDEFPDILKIEKGDNILGQMRTKIQNQDVPYIFAGSHRGEMRNIFANPDHHFFSSAAALGISRFNIDYLAEFCINKFSEGKRTLLPFIFKEIYNLTQGITGDTYQLCHEIWDNTGPGSLIDLAVVEKSLKNLCELKSDAFTLIVNNLSITQKKFLRGMIISKGQNLYTSQFIRTNKLKNKDEVKNTIKALMKSSILYKKEDELKFYDPFFFQWLTKLYLF